MKLSLKKRIYGVLGLGLIILIVMGIVSFLGMMHLAKAAEEVAVEQASIRQIILVVSGGSLLAGVIVVITIFVINLDITKRRHFEEALQESKARFRIIFEEASIGIGLINLQGRIVMSNPAMQQLYGYSAEELAGLALATELTHAEDTELSEMLLQELIRGERQSYQIEKRYIHKAGQVVWGHTTVSLVRDDQGQPLYVIGMIEDITQRKRAGEILAQRATQLMLINDISSKIAAVLDLDSVLDRAAYLVQHTFDYHHVALFVLDNDVARLQALAGSYTAYFPPNHTQELDQGIIGWVATHGEKLIVNDVSQEPRYISKIADQTVTRAELCLPIKVAGQIIGILDIQSPTLNAFGENDILLMEILVAQIAVAIENAHLYQAVRQELVERKRMEEALAQERNLLRAFVDHVPDYMYVKDTESRFIMANQSVAELMGVNDPVEVIGKTDFDFYPESMATKFFNDEQAIIRSGYPLINCEERVLDRSMNEERWNLTAKVPFQDSEGNIIGLVGLSRDITKSKQMVQRLRESEERFRQLAENIDHKLPAL